MILVRRLVFGLILVAGYGCTGPIGPIAGGELAGENRPYPASWNEAAAVEQVQLETYETSGQPHSVNIWCVVHTDRLFFVTSLVRGEEMPEKRGWVQNALANQAARVRVGEAIFEGNLNKIQDDALTSNVKDAFILKYDEDTDERTQNAWVFEFVQP